MIIQVLKIITVSALMLATVINSGAQDRTGLADRPGTFEILSRTDYAMPESVLPGLT
jgi:hypothetical protein